ncbi:MAG TPA: hypothetical protein PLP01_07700 [Phycisphaerae bacterium]|nr:hypothetical protein [Phycisphaerae bacterium]HOI55118.1 hypothetical protein [Phycisphaerae bacterium]
MSDDLIETLGQQARRERRNESDRRTGEDRRKGGPSDYCGPERRQGDRRVTAERRLGGIAGRREEDRKAFEERIENGELTLEEVEFIRAIDRYKRKYSRPFPTWSEILLIVKELGYTKDSI